MRKAVIRPTWNFNGNGTGLKYVSEDLERDFNEQNYFQTTYYGMWIGFSKYLNGLAKSRHSDESEAFKLLSENSENLASGRKLSWGVDEIGHVKSVETMKRISLPPKERITYEESPISDDGYRIINDFFKQIAKATYGIRCGLLKGSKSHQEEIIRFLKKEKDEGCPYQILDAYALLEYLPGFLGPEQEVQLGHGDARLP